jgi:hypothetical protein
MFLIKPGTILSLAPATMQKIKSAKKGRGQVWARPRIRFALIARARNKAPNIPTATLTIPSIRWILSPATGSSRMDSALAEIDRNAPMPPIMAPARMLKASNNCGSGFDCELPGGPLQAPRITLKVFPLPLDTKVARFQCLSN